MRYKTDNTHLKPKALTIHHEAKEKQDILMSDITNLSVEVTGNDYLYTKY